VFLPDGTQLRAWNRSGYAERGGDALRALMSSPSTSTPPIGFITPEEKQ
jgi:hypothetical protein